jgi:hypothetical protein
MALVEGKEMGAPYRESVAFKILHSTKQGINLQRF